MRRRRTRCDSLSFVSTSVAKGSAPGGRAGPSGSRGAAAGLSKQRTRPILPRGKKRPRGREGRKGGVGHQRELPPATRRKSDARGMEEAASLHILLSNALYTSSHGTLKGLKDTFVMNKCTISVSVDVEAGTSSLHCGAMLFLLPLDGGRSLPPLVRANDDFLWERH